MQVSRYWLIIIAIFVVLVVTQRSEGAEDPPKDNSELESLRAELESLKTEVEGHSHEATPQDHTHTYGWFKSKTQGPNAVEAKEPTEAPPATA